MTGIGSKDIHEESCSENPLVSVITVVFNGEKHLEQAILSVLSQTYGNVEYIIIDGGSSDGTLDIIRKHEDRIDRWVSEPDEGIYDAMNKGIALASGEIIGMLNSDDWYTPDALDEVAKSYSRSPDKRIVILGKWNAIFEDLGMAISVAPSTEFHKLRLCHQAMFIPKKAYELFGTYDLTYRYSADLDMALRLYVNKVKFLFLDMNVVNFRTSGASGRNYRKTGREQAITIRKHLSYRTYLLFRLLRLKFEALSCLAEAIERLLGKRFSGSLRKYYYSITTGQASRGGS